MSSSKKHLPLSSKHASDRDKKTGMTPFYQWVYDTPTMINRLDRNLVPQILLFFQSQRLMQWYLDQISAGNRVWQVAHVYGDLVKKVASKVGSQGIFHLTDISALQAERAKRKLKKYPWASIFCSDAGTFAKKPSYDIVSSFFLLHEIPDVKKREVVDNMLKHLSKEGMAIFVDYHKPAFWHPVRYILLFVNAFLEPFAKSLWHNDIRDFASNSASFTWQKHTLFGGVYQCVIARHLPKTSKNT